MSDPFKPITDALGTAKLKPGFEVDCTFSPFYNLPTDGPVLFGCAVDERGRLWAWDQKRGKLVLVADFIIELGARRA